MAINGFGRIGRPVFKAALKKTGDISVVAINDLMKPSVLANLLKYDSVYGKYEKEVKATDKSIIIDGKEIPIIAEKDPSKLPWKDFEVDVVVESTGFFVSGDNADGHIKAGANKVIISAPSKGKEVSTYLMGVNHSEYKGESVIDMASCTTNSIAPVAEIMTRHFEVEKSIMVTVHSYTSTQSVVDGPSEDDLRRGRAAAVNIVPTSTGAAIAASKAVPALKGKFDGIALRVPVVDGCIADTSFVLKKNTTVEEVNKVFEAEAKGDRYKGILAVTSEPLVSTDIIGTDESSIVSLDLTRVVDGNLVKVVSWYDNEWAYSVRMVELACYIAKK